MWLLHINGGGYFQNNVVIFVPNIFMMCFAFRHNKGLSTSNSRNLESSESTNVTTRELIDKSSTIIIRDGSANANNGDANNKLDHIELQLGDLTHLVNTLIMRQHDKDSAMRSSSERLLFENGSAAKKEGKEGEESKKQASELATLEQLQRLFQQQLAQVNSQKTSNVNLMHHHQFISSVKGALSSIKQCRL